MRKLLVTAFIACSAAIMAQSNVDTRNFVEVTGTSETEIVPDEIYVTICLKERFEGKDKVALEKQEADLKAALTELGIPLTNLSLNDANADYKRVKIGKKDLIAQKSFLLKLSDVSTLDKVYKKLDAQNVEDAFISKLNHTKLQDYAKENRIKAIKAAKDKVDYLLAAVGQTAGKPYLIDEVENAIYNTPYNSYGGYNFSYRGGRNSMSNAVQSYNTGGNAYDSVEGGSGEISFTKIRIKASYFVKYEIVTK
jgi:uncharacterized protein